MPKLKLIRNSSAKTQMPKWSIILSGQFSNTYRLKCNPRFFQSASWTPGDFIKNFGVKSSFMGLTSGQIQLKQKTNLFKFEIFRWNLISIGNVFQIDFKTISVSVIFSMKYALYFKLICTFGFYRSILFLYSRNVSLCLVHCHREKLTN